MTRRNVMRAALSAMLISLLLPSAGTARTIVRFSQKQAMPVTPVQVSDHTWKTPCQDGLVPYEISFSFDLTKYGDVRTTEQLFLTDSDVRLRRGAELENQRPDVATSLTSGDYISDQPLNITGQIRACGFRKQYFVMGADASVSGQTGDLFISETLSDIVRRERKRFSSYSYFVFKAGLNGAPHLHVWDIASRDANGKVTKITKRDAHSGFSNADVWGAQQFAVRLERPEGDFDGGRVRLNGDMEFEFQLLVIEE